LASVKEQWNLTLRAWRESAPFWEKHAAVIRAMFEPLSGARHPGQRPQMRGG